MHHAVTPAHFSGISCPIATGITTRTAKTHFRERGWWFAVDVDRVEGRFIAKVEKHYRVASAGYCLRTCDECITVVALHCARFSAKLGSCFH